MRKAVFLLLLVLMVYVAGIYGSTPLMVLAAAETVTLAVMFGLSRYLTGKLTVRAPALSGYAVKGETFFFEPEAENRGRFPVAKFRLQVEKGYENSEPEGTELIYGSCSRGEQRLSLEVQAGYCGRIMLHIREIRVYDYLSVFSSGKKADVRWTAAVFPAERSMKITFSGRTAQQYAREQEVSSRQGQAFDEVRQIREYRAGDPLRHIHWNQTARSGVLWVKEYEGEQRSAVTLFLDWKNPGIKKGPEKTREQMDTFYEVLSAMTAGLLKETGMVRVLWCDPYSGKLSDMVLTGPGQRRELLMRLYQIRFPSDADPGVNGRTGIKEGGLCLDTDLVWSKEGTVIWRFSRERLDEDISLRQYVI